jgi:DNA-binding SARP family transcriptional activator
MEGKPRRASRQKAPPPLPDARNWTLRLLGGATLHDPEGRPARLGRRAAVLLALLALEGPQHRVRMASLLWPDAPMATARADLRQLLLRLREAAGVELVESEEDPLRLSPHLEVDAARLEQWASAGRTAEVARMEGELLSGLDYDDCPELDDWVHRQRQSLKELCQRAREEEAARLEREGAVQAALEWNRRVLDVDSTREDAWRRAMRLHLLLGDRGAALRAYDRCRLVLEHELGVEPSEETRRLARLIESGAAPRVGTSKARKELPLSVLRPRVLAGREREWARLEAAWNARQGVFISGAPGLGKSRLLTELAASRCERTLLLEARPGETAVPFPLCVRWWRMLLAGQPGLVLPAWVRRELSRVMPELGEPPAPSTPELDLSRLFEAQLELLRLAGRDLAALLIDDVHLGDSASLEVLAYLLGHLPDSPELPRFLTALDPEEMTPELERLIRGLVDSGLAVRVELEPLDREQVGRLLGGVDVEEAAALAEPLTRHTGGNPLFVVETLECLLESGELAPPPSGRLPVPDEVGRLLARRLARLSRPALQLARTVAVARDRFSLELASEVLDTPMVELAGQWDELSAARLVQGHGFAHELYREVVLQGMPEPVGAWLHRRVAEALSTLQRGG